MKEEEFAAVEKEVVRWQERIEDTLRRLGIEPFDASGNESGDPLDFTDDQIRHAIVELQEQVDELKEQMAKTIAGRGA